MTVWLLSFIAPPAALELMPLEGCCAVSLVTSTKARERKPGFPCHGVAASDVIRSLFLGSPLSCEFACVFRRSADLFVTLQQAFMA